MNPLKLKIFSDRHYLPDGMEHVVMLCPFWGNLAEDPGAPEAGRYQTYTKAGQVFFEMTSLHEADLAVVPAPWEKVVQNRAARDLMLQFADCVRRARRQIVTFFWSDSTEAVSVEGATVFRTSFYRSQRRPGEFAMPAWSEDFAEKYLGGQLLVRRKRGRPTIGFCGYSAPLEVSVKALLRSGLRQMETLLRRGRRGTSVQWSGPLIRREALRALSGCALVDCNFIIRERFYGGVLLAGGREDLSVARRVRKEFVGNMVDSDYILCARGGGNFSYRLYETLSCGRIPVFVDTDCVLPYDFAVEWKKYCVWIDRSKIPLIGEKIAEFHDALSPQDFEDLQHECRRLWKEWLSPEGFFANLYRHFHPKKHGW